MKAIQKIMKAFIVAFSIYSKIPMPRFNWESDDMKYHLCFFPWVGGVIGGLEILLFEISRSLGLGQGFYVAFAMVIPLLITGGFHLDGFMDTCDAIHSYQPKEKKLEILKDPHIGAFAVICVLSYMLLAAGTLALVEDGVMVVVGACGFFLSRVLSGISVVTMQGAKKQGMLQTFSDTAGKRTVLICLVSEGIICSAVMCFTHLIYGVVAMGMMGFTYLYYGRMSKKEFDGITGDLAGFFVSVSELSTVMGLVFVGTILRIMG